MKKQVTYLSMLSLEYSTGIRNCDTLEDLQRFTSEWRPYANDAFERTAGMDEIAFRDYKKGLLRESSGRYAGDVWAKKYGAVVMPELLFFLTLQAERLKVPEGVIFFRLLDGGFILENKVDHTFYIDKSKWK